MFRRESSKHLLLANLQPICVRRAEISHQHFDHLPNLTTVRRCNQLSESPITKTPGCDPPRVNTSLSSVASAATLKTGSLTTDSAAITFVVKATPSTPGDISHLLACASTR